MEGIELNDNLREITISVMGGVPVAGSVLSSLLTIIWKEAKEDVWTTLRGRVEEVVGNKIEDNDFRRLQEELDGIKNRLEGLKDDFTQINWRNNFNYLDGQRNIFLATKHDENYQLAMLPQAALFGLLFTNLWKLGESHSWLTNHHTVAVKEFYKQLRELSDNQYERKINQIKKKHNWSDFIYEPEGAWKEYVNAHNMFVLNIYPCVEMIDAILNKKKEIYNKYEIYEPKIGSVFYKKLEDLPKNLRERTMKKLTVWHGGAIDGLHVEYSDGSGSGAGTIVNGKPTEIDLTGKYITHIDFYTETYESKRPNGARSLIQHMKLYFSDGTSSEFGGDKGGYDYTSVKHENWCISWLHGNNSNYYREVGLQVGLMPVSEYKKLLSPTPGPIDHPLAIDDPLMPIQRIYDPLAYLAT